MINPEVISSPNSKNVFAQDAEMSQAYSEASCSSVNMEKIQNQSTSTSTSEDEPKYAGFDIETINCVAEQFTDNEVSDEARSALAEDATFRMREILTASLINMHHAKRNFLKLDDVNAVFKRMRIEPIYGTGLLNFETFGDPKDYSTIPDNPKNLVETATADATFKEPGDVGVTYAWIKETSLFNQMLIDDTFENYAEKIVNAVASDKKSLRNFALKDLATNIRIGPILPNLAEFCFTILQKDESFGVLTTSTLEQLEAILFNPCVAFSLNEEQVILFIYLILEKITNVTNKMLDEIEPFCRILGRLCKCWTNGGIAFIEKLKSDIPEDSPAVVLTAPVTLGLNYIGNDAIKAVLWPNITKLLKHVRELSSVDSLELRYTILTSAYISYKINALDSATDFVLREEFGDSLVPFFNLRVYRRRKKSEDETEVLFGKDSVGVRLALLKNQSVHSQQDLTGRTSLLKTYFRNAKPPVYVNRKPIVISGYNAIPIRKKLEINEEIYEAKPRDKASVDVITGRRTLYTYTKLLVGRNSRITNLKDFLYM